MSAARAIADSGPSDSYAIATMKTLQHGWHRIVGQALGAAFIPLILSFALHAQPTNYYVDAGLGNNAYDGFSNVVVNGHGPKLNIANAISTASSGDAIVVATGFYQELLWDLGTKSLTLNPQGQVTVYDGDPWQTDSIGDGISDGWRQYYFGSSTTTNSSSCASCDTDGDGFNNLQEFLMGTNPSDTNSPGLRNLFFYDNLGRLAVVISTNGTDAAFYRLRCSGEHHRHSSADRGLRQPVRVFVHDRQRQHDDYASGHRL